MTPVDPRDDKSQLRKTLRQALRAIDGADLERWSEQITGRLLDCPQYQRSESIMVYLSLAGEYQTETLIGEAMRSGKTVCAPKVTWQTSQMVPVVLRTCDDFDVDDHGINEPRWDRSLPIDRLDFILVPGLGFDPQGRRLGRGCGFYDKFLANVGARAIKLAAAFDLQIVPSVPVADHDQPVDIIITPTKLVRVHISK